MISNKIWAIIGKVAMLLAMLSAIIVVVKYYSEPTYKLIAEVSYSNFFFPKSMLDRIDEKLFTYADIQAYIRIRNKGNLSCEVTSLKFTNLEEATIIGDDGKKTYFTNTNTINIGSLKPSENVIIYAWFRSYPRDNIILNHKNGTGKVLIKTEPPAIEELYEKHGK